MKKIKLLLWTLFFFSASSWAAQCKVDIQNEIHLNSDRVEIYKSETDKIVIDDENNIYLHGKKMSLTNIQKSAIEAYRASIEEALPKAKQFASEGLSFAYALLDDVEASIDVPNAFDSMKDSMQQFFDDIEGRYYKGGDFILPATSFESLAKIWMDDIKRAKEMFNQELFTTALQAISAKAKFNEGINLTELANMVDSLQATVTERVKEYSSLVEEDAKEWCDSLKEMVTQEEQLHKKIPEFKDYKVFTI